jgi:hypothetical protein
LNHTQENDQNTQNEPQHDYQSPRLPAKLSE